jgi:hypothetical protein
LAKDVPAIPVYHYVRTHLVKPWVGDLRRISWGITTPKICTSKNINQASPIDADFLRELPEFQTNNTFCLFLRQLNKLCFTA